MRCAPTRSSRSSSRCSPRNSHLRFVVLGDSTAEGVGDPGPTGAWRGFGDRLAERLGPSTTYTKLAVSGAVTREIRDGQLATAVALRPDLAAIMAGMNDLLRPRFDAGAIGDDLAAMYGALGGTRIGFTIPDVAHRLAPPGIARMLSRRVAALNDTIRRVARAHGVHVIDLAALAMADDPRMWSGDRLHGNPESHARMAAACAEVLGLPGADHRWAEPLPPAPAVGVVARVADDLAWARRYMLPWLAAKTIRAATRRRPAARSRSASGPA